MQKVLLKVESGPFLAKVQELAQLRHERQRAIKKYLMTIPGVTSFRISDDGHVSFLRFNSAAVPAGFTKPDSEGYARPKKGSQWVEKLALLEPLPNMDFLVGEAFKIPAIIDYKRPGDTSHASAAVDFGFASCGLSYPHPSGPFAIWFPDVEAVAQSYREKDYEVVGPCADFKAEFEGCTRTTQEEWAGVMREAQANHAEDLTLPTNEEPAYVALHEGSYQERVLPWMTACLGHQVAFDSKERLARATEEFLELAQAAAMTKDDVLALVDHVFSRPAGTVEKELGGVMLTLAGFANANNLDMNAAGDAELIRVGDPNMMARIREKHASKPKDSPLPGTSLRPSMGH
ncbi:hypothetical protein ACKF11_13265 [Methylobacillus sp. Pita2]|uniref:hypothetical protein n=1 Tax=Methylobacillus sp. Pita2 TaxID=3383245 RepID=UPI0038B59A90